MHDPKVVDLNRTLHDLTEDYPELAPLLAELGLEGAANPLLRHTVGRRIRLREGIERHGLDLAKVEARLREAGFAVRGGADDPGERRKALKQIIRDIHRQKDPAELKARFRDLLASVGPTEIAQLEQELMQEGMPESEIKSLCDVHVAVFQEGLEQQVKPEEQGGHPVHTFKKENRALAGVIAEIRSICERFKAGQELPGDLQSWRKWHADLMEVEKHYSRKENILFAYLEKHGVSAPPKVMWAIHDDIRAWLKEIQAALAKPDLSKEEARELIVRSVEPTLKAIEDMIYKEENIMFPMSLETLSEGEWAAVAEQSAEIGYCLVKPDEGWTASVPPEPAVRGAYADKPAGKTGGDRTGVIAFDTGVLTPEQIGLLLDHLPLDITFVDKEDTVRYFSRGQERIFQRSKAIIGRKVQNCHPPDSVHIVNRILADFKSGQRDEAKFWIHYGGKYVYIQYYAVRNAQGEYVGTIEVTQDIQGIQQISGEKRIYDES